MGMLYPSRVDRHFTRTPNFVFDLAMPCMTGAEFKVFCYLIRRAYGFHSEELSATVSLSDICTGISGTPDLGTGLQRSTVKEAIASLESSGFIEVRRPANNLTPNTYYLETDEMQQWAETEYEKRFRELCDRHSSEGVVGKSDQPGEEGVGRKSAHPPGRKSAHPQAENRPTPYIERKKEEKESLQKETPLPPSPPGKEETSETNVRSDVNVTLELPTPSPLPAEPALTVNADDLDLDTEIFAWLKRQYRMKRGAKLVNLDASTQRAVRFRIEELIQTFGEEEFRTTVLYYLSVDEDWLRRDKYPIGKLVGDGFRNWHRSANQSRGQAPDAPAVLRVPPAPGSAPQRPIWNAIVECWNGICSDAGHMEWQVKTWMEKLDVTRDMLELSGTSSSTFYANGDGLARDAMAKAVELKSANPEKAAWITFRWLWKNNNWWKVLQGEYNWLLSGKRPEETQDDILEAIRRYRKGEE